MLSLTYSNTDLVNSTLNHSVITMSCLISICYREYLICLVITTVNKTVVCSDILLYYSLDGTEFVLQMHLQLSWKLFPNMKFDGISTHAYIFIYLLACLLTYLFLYFWQCKQTLWPEVEDYDISGQSLACIY